MCSLYLILGVLFVGAGRALVRSRFPEFAGATEKFGLLTVHHSAFPLTLGFFYGQDAIEPAGWWVAAAVAAAALALLSLDLRRDPEGLPAEWHWIWSGALLGVVLVAAAGLGLRESGGNLRSHDPGPHWVVLPAMFAFSLLQIRVGLHRRIPFFVNLGIVSVAIQILTAYLQLFGTMADTGLVFLSAGGLLIGMGWYLERRRRALLRSMSAAAQGPQPEETR